MDIEPKQLKTLREDGYNFTPKLESGQRVQMKISEPDIAKVRRGSTALMGIFTDQLTGRRFKVYGAACSLPNCKCDAVATEVAAETT